MQKTFSFLAFLIFIVSCSSPNASDCSKFKVGKFQIRSEFAEGAITTVLRNGTVQTETDERTGLVVREKIRWISDCEYELTFLSSTGDSINAMADFLKTHPLNTKIIKTGTDYYVFQTSAEGAGSILTDTMMLIK